MKVDIKEFKIEKKVFDERTLLAIFKLMKRDFLKTVESVVKEGKESIIFSAKDKNGNWLALKVYRVQYCDFRNMWKYLVNDPRFKNIKKDRRIVVNNWCKREFKNLKTAFENNVSCPKPIAFNENVLLMSFLGKDGKPAPRLIDTILDKEDAQAIYEFVLREMEKLTKARLIHSDMSEYNILLFEKPYLIDFSQAVTLEHPLAKEFLARDIRNINLYFQKLGAKIKNSDELFNYLLKLVE